MLNNLCHFLNFPFVSSLILLLPLTVWIIVIILKIFGLDYPYELISDPIGIDNITNISTYLLIANLIINFISILRLNMKTVSDDEAESIRKLSLIHAGIMSIAAGYTFIIYVLYGLEKLGNIPVGRG